MSISAADLRLPTELDDLRRVLRQHGVVTASVFGSFARGDAGPESDFDVLVQYGPGVSLFDHIDLRQQLEEQTGRTVDVVSDRSLSRHFRPYVEAEKVEIL